jgi:hypothetical protein
MEYFVSHYIINFVHRLIGILYSMCDSAFKWQRLQQNGISFFMVV